MPPRSGIQSMTTKTRFDHLTHQSEGPRDLSGNRIVPGATPRASFGFLTREITRIRSRSSLLFNWMTAMIRQSRRTNRLPQRSTPSSRAKFPIFDLRMRQTMSTLALSAVLTRWLETPIVSGSKPPLAGCNTSERPTGSRVSLNCLPCPDCVPTQRFVVTATRCSSMAFGCRPRSNPSVCCPQLWRGRAATVCAGRGVS